jgi:hypothetical protein
VRQLPVAAPGTQTEEPLFLTPAEAAAALEVSEDVLRMQRESGQGPRYVAITARSVLYFRVEVEGFRARRSFA